MAEACSASRVITGAPIEQRAAGCVRASWLEKAAGFQRFDRVSYGLCLYSSVGSCDQTGTFSVVHSPESWF